MRTSGGWAAEAPNIEADWLGYEDDDVQELIASITLHQGISCHLGASDIAHVERVRSLPPHKRARRSAPRMPEPRPAPSVYTPPPEPPPKTIVREKPEAPPPPPRQDPPAMFYVHARSEGDEITDHGVVRTIKVMEGHAPERTLQTLRFMHPIDRAFIGGAVLRVIRAWEIKLTERQEEDEAMAGIPKFDYVRSDKLMRAYGKIECQHCGADDGTVVGAHSNWSVHGKGRGIKASDVFCASLCARCHWRLDQDMTMLKDERKAFWWAAWRKTIRALRERGLWPDGIEAPKP